ncbi:hypothetical protein SAMN06295879_0644 [Agreia bicolorata]|uniref:DUF3592 domain-containing protein n=1 Tax=Agreia bicolorata TaxID=110935 RepID=A0A1T4X777_9MICO|nr:DUF3592 domain-containing protein [Agreia bicolorata]SKA84711.1 hypothetical protein SAMN06295879_0644 [Agreia bicolorata]
MSTSDPRVERAERQAAAAKRPGTTIVIVLLGAAHLAVWMVAGFGIGTILDTFRLMTVNQVGNWNSGFDAVDSQFLAVGAICIGSFLGVFFTGRLGRAGLGGAALIVPFCTGLLGIAIGLLLFIPNWSPPDAIGEKVAFIDGGDTEPWQSDAWVAYYLPYWLPAAFGVLLLLAVVATLAAIRATHRSLVRMKDIESRGTRVPGVVTEAIATGTEIQGMPRIQFTARFRDTAGTNRWVTKKATFPRAATPRAGDPAVVWFDPLAPHDETKIMVGLGPEAAQHAGQSAVLPRTDLRG